MLEFLRSRTFLLHFLCSVIVSTLLLMITYYWLGAYTKHGNMIVVPDLKGKNWQNLDETLAQKKLELEIADSSIYLIDQPAGMVIEQDPSAGSYVKEGRKIYITVSKIVPPQVKMPNIIDVSDRQAEAILGSYGLKSGEKIYRPDLAKNAVLAMTLNEKMLKPGDEVPKGSIIDLILGDGVGNTEVKVPELVGLNYEEALFVLRGSSLAVGATVFDDGVTDTMNAVIYKQFPEAADSSFLKQGEQVDLYFKR